jgi:hypothetical protein
MFFKGSRYERVPEDTYVDQSGRAIRYKRIRFIPPTPASLAHQVAQGERLDHIAFLAYRDAERSWRICDANEAMWPPDLVAEIRARILIPPAGGP